MPSSYLTAKLLLKLQKNRAKNSIYTKRSVRQKNQGSDMAIVLVSDNTTGVKLLKDNMLKDT